LQDSFENVLGWALKYIIKMIDLDELQKEILQQTEVNRLYEIQIELSKLIKNAHRQNLMAETTMEQSEAKGNLGIFHSMLDVLQNRVSEIKEVDKEERYEQGRINFNFRLAAKTVLQKETYKQIMDLAIRTRTEIKEDQKELKRNKLG
jgi:hypothetical protein